MVGRLSCHRPTDRQERYPIFVRVGDDTSRGGLTLPRPFGVSVREPHLTSTDGRALGLLPGSASFAPAFRRRRICCGSSSRVSGGPARPARFVRTWVSSVGPTANKPRTVSRLNVPRRDSGPRRNCQYRCQPQLLRRLSPPAGIRAPMQRSGIFRWERR